jgi:hypothetical protein
MNSKANFETSFSFDMLKLWVYCIQRVQSHHGVVRVHLQRNAGVHAVADDDPSRTVTHRNAHFLFGYDAAHTHTVDRVKNSLLTYPK